jgi:MFS transporter, Spinster family, sphingosine-1-phosphate transporter
MNPAVLEPVKPVRETSAPFGAGILVGSMWVAYLLNYCDRQAVFSMFPILKSELGFSDTQLGLIGAIFSGFYAIFSPIAGQIADKVSKPRLIIASLILWSVVTVLTGFSVSITMMLCCRAVMSISESLFVPAAVSLTCGVYSPQARSRAVAILMTSQIAGVIAGGWFSGVMAEHGHWRGAFFTLGTVGLLYAIPYHFCLKRGAGLVRAETRSSGSLLAIVDLVRIPSYLALGAVFSVFTFGIWLAYGWLPTFFHEKFSLGLGDAAFNATFFLQGATIVGMVGGGWISDRLYRRRQSARFWLIGSGLLVCAPFFHLMGNCDTLFHTKLAAMALGIFSGLIIANVFPAAFEVVPLNTRSSAVGFLNCFGSTLSGTGLLLGGYLKQSLGLAHLISIAALAYAVAGLCMLAAMKAWFWRDYAKVH